MTHSHMPAGDSCCFICTKASNSSFFLITSSCCFFCSGLTTMSNGLGVSDWFVCLSLALHFLVVLNLGMRRGLLAWGDSALSVPPVDRLIRIAGRAEGLLGECLIGAPAVDVMRALGGLAFSLPRGEVWGTILRDITAGGRVTCTDSCCSSRFSCAEGCTRDCGCC